MVVIKIMILKLTEPTCLSSTVGPLPKSKAILTGTKHG